MATEPTDAINLLKADHRKVEDLFAQFERASSEEEKRTDGMFAQAKKAGVDIKALGVQIMERKKELLEKIKSDGLPPPVTRTLRVPGPEKGPPPSFADEK
jgi:hypothetical protein